MPKTTRDAPRAPRRPGEEHATLLSRFDELASRIRAGPARELLQPWLAFAADLHAHFAFEEDMLFPAFAQQNRDARELVRSLVAEHAAARQLAEEIGLQLRRQDIRTSTLEVLSDLLREHAEVKNARIYSGSGPGS